MRLLQVVSDVYCLYLTVIQIEQVTASTEVAPPVSDAPCASLSNNHIVKNEIFLVSKVS
jgi:hypothetical protein